jgi:hypothetical protein
MPKRSRTESPSPASKANAGLEEELMEKEETAHTPKYFRSSHSPSPSSSASASAVQNKEMHCNLPPHQPLTLSSITDFETHYLKEHTNRCYECNANLPSSWLLELHISEKHDPIVAAKRSKEEKTVWLRQNIVLA